MRSITISLGTAIALSLPGPRNAFGHEPITQAYLQGIANRICDTAGTSRIRVALDETVKAAQAEYRQMRPVIACNPKYLALLQRQTGTEWSLWWVMAHEIAHHTRQHTRTPSGNRVRNEWDADYIAGYILGRLGAPLLHAQAGAGHAGNGLQPTYRYRASPCQHLTLYALYSTYPNHQTFVEYRSRQEHVFDYRAEPVLIRTHPPQQDRLQAVEMGWTAARRG